MVFKNIPQIQCPIFNQWQLEDALKTMDECYFTIDHPDLLHGFFAPGGKYGKDWWAWDYSITIDAAKWIDFELAENFIDNLSNGQRPDGRIKLYGADDFSHVPNVQEEISGSPIYLVVTYGVANACEDEAKAQKAYNLLTGALGWWFAKRQNPETKLITTIFEEGSPNNDVSPSGNYAPVDSNMFVAMGCMGTAKLAERYGNAEEAKYYREKGEEILAAMETYMWNEEDGCYYPYVHSLNSQYKILLASTFHGFRLPGKERHERLVALLTDTKVFNWDFIPLTTLAMTDSLFTVMEGTYLTGSVCHRGMIWPYANNYAVKALRAAGYEELAATLMQKTVNTFAGRYTEFIHPFNNSQNGEERYAVTAAMVLQLVIEDLFGLSYTKEDGLKVNPCLPECCKKANMWLKGIVLPNGETVNVYIEQGAARVEKV